MKGIKDHYTEINWELDVKDGEVQYHDNDMPKFVKRAKIKYDILITEVVIAMLVAALGYILSIQNW
jgi:hypothetical protein